MVIQEANAEGQAVKEYKNDPKSRLEALPICYMVDETPMLLVPFLRTPVGDIAASPHPAEQSKPLNSGISVPERQASYCTYQVLSLAKA